MNKLNSWFSQYRDLIRILVPFLLLLVILGLFLFYFGKLGNSESFNIVLGISLGIFAGFFADASKRDWDLYQENKKFKRTALKLLEQDAKSIFRTYEMWRDIRKTVGKPGTPPGIEHMLPPQLEMKYWDKLSQNDEFLLLAEDDKFEKIFRRFWDFKKLAQLIEEASGDKKNERIKQAYMFAMAMSQQTLADESHTSLIELFLSSDEVKKYKENWRKIGN